MSSKAARGMNERRSLNLTLAIREGIGPDVLYNFMLAILKGENPRLIEDKSKPGGFYVRHDDGQPAPTLQDKLRVVKEMSDRGWGMPVQAIALDADLRAHVLAAGQQLPSGQLPPSALWAVEQAIRGALPAASPAPATASADDDHNVIDAECTEAPASASDHDDDLEDDLEDEQAPASATASADDE